MSKRKYPLELLEMIIQQYDPAKENSYEKCISQLGIEEILCETDEECAVIRVRIQEEVFQAAADKKRSKQLVRYYHTSLTHYMNILYEKLVCIDSCCKPTRDLYHALLEQLNCLLDFIESSFQNYLENDLKVTRFYLHKVKRTMREKIDVLRIREAKLEDLHSRTVCNIILNALDRFVNTSKFHYKVTYRCIHYRMELIRKLEMLSDWESDQASNDFPLDRFLIYMNFNSKTYIDYVTQYLSQWINNKDPALQMDFLLVYYKEFKQLHSKSDLAFNPEYHNIDTLLENWFAQEIAYRRNVSQNPLNFPAIQQNLTQNQPVKTKAKVLCSLSSDQIAVLLRAADEMRILSARSMTEVFRTIVPHLSTPTRKDLSYESVRTKSYDPESGDKQIVVEILLRMIDKIQNY